VSDTLISLAGVGKDYPMVSTGAGRLRTLLSLVTGGGVVEHLSALEGVDLEVKRGESLGLVGENGAGKSTLLKVIAGVVRPTRGTATVNGRVGALLELGSGFHPDYTGRDNIALSAALAGLSRGEVASRIADIIAFADIGAHIDQPVKHYSSGMVVRLGFAIATALEPDVLITDEVLAVGDESFQRKCIRWMEDYLADGGTLLLCSHGMYHVQTLCQKAAWLHQGRLRAYGDSFSVTQDYLAYHEEKRRAESPFGDRVAYAGDYFAVRSVSTHDDRGEPCAEFGMDEPLDVRIEIYSPDDRPPVALVGIVRADGTPVYGTHSDERGFEPRRTGPQRYAFAVRFPRCPLIPGKYVLRAHALDPEGLRLYDTVEAGFTVRGATRDYGLVRLEHAWHAPPD
jgi:lipopolysaccharide transport system ATP-binding protein